jgi:hypothetical protein
MNRFYRLLAYGYFPKELPPIFSTKNFARNTHDLIDIETYTNNKWQATCPFLLQQKVYYRRKLDLLAPQSFLKQAYLITKNYDEVKSRIACSEGNCSRPAFNRKTKFNRSVRPFAIGRGYAQRKLKIRSRFPIILKLDVKNYYRSVYTHSIAWAFHGKEYSKRHTREENLGNNLDKAFMQGQDGQTIGIPTGPDTSFIISELLLSQIFYDLFQDEKLKTDRFLRYYDDIQYGCESEEEAHRVIALFEDALQNYGLEVNSDKTQIISGPHSIEQPWIFQLRNIEWKSNIEIDFLLSMFSFVAEIAYEYKEDHVFRYFLQKMRTVVVSENAWTDYQRILLSLLQENTGNAKEVFQQFLYYQKMGWTIDKKAIAESLHRKIAYQLSRRVTSELSWAIYGLFIFGIKPEQQLAKKILEKGDACSRILISKIIFERQMPLRTTINDIIKSWGNEVLNSSEWIYAYEILVNRWHNRYNGVSIPPKNSELFEHIRDRNVSFLNDAESLISKIPKAFKDQMEKEKARQRLDVNNDHVDVSWENEETGIEGDFEDDIERTGDDDDEIDWDDEDIDY